VMKREHALVWTTHPRTKGSTGYPEKIKGADYFRSDRWLGAAFKALPVDLSQKRLGEVRCFGTLDDMNNWGGPKFGGVLSQLNGGHGDPLAHRPDVVSQARRHRRRPLPHPAVLVPIL
jgi:hypothetical protein